jgi:hypothetical protein
LAHIRFSLFRFRSPLLTESRLFSLPVGTEMFHFPTFPLSALYIQAEIMGHDSHWVPPFGNPRIKALLAAPRGFSQPHTTFFGFWSLGIRHLHLIIFLHCFKVKNQILTMTLNLKDARVHCVVLKIRASLGVVTAYQITISGNRQFDRSLSPEGSYPQDPTTCMKQFHKRERSTPRLTARLY